MQKFKWTVIDFGKFKDKGMTLPKIVLTDPDWFFFLIEKEAFTDELARQAQDIAAKATKIRIPGKSSKRWKVRYVFTREGRFEHFDVIDRHDTWYSGSGFIKISDFIDLSIVHQHKAYDKQGGKRLIKGLKFQLFGRTNVRLTKQVCEKFFENPRNFG